MNEIIEKIINQWDPIGLFPGAPQDEYKDEINSIYLFTKNNNNLTIESLADEIYKIFIKSFGEDIFALKKEDCRNIAVAIIKEMKNHLVN